jgi:lysophospholipase L1-like esterase
MSTPAGITRIDCTLGVFSAQESGADLGAVVTVTASRPALVWAATGEVLFSDPYTVTAADGGAITVPLIPTDLAGWLIGGLPLEIADGEHTHTYDIKVQPVATVAEGKTRKVGEPVYYKRVVVPADTDGALDLDTSAEVSSPAGGTVTVPDLVSGLAAAVAADADRAETAAAAAEAVGDTNDTIMAGVAADTDSDFYAVQTATSVALIEAEVPAIAAPIAAATVAADRNEWQRSRADDSLTLTAPRDTPTLAWTDTGSSTSTSGITSPVTYRPSANGTGSLVSGWSAQDDPNFRFFSGSFSTVNGANNDLALYGDNKPGSVSGAYRWPVVFSFITSATNANLELVFWGSPASTSLMIEVNGKMTSLEMITAPASLGVTGKYIALTFPEAAARTIRVWCAGGTKIYGVRVPTGQTITKPAFNGQRVAIIGDSYTNGAGSSSSFPNRGASSLECFTPRLGRMLGASDLIQAGIGGTGWITNGEGTPFIDRLDEVLAMAAASGGLDTLIFYGSTNDTPTPDQAALQAAVEAALALCASVPNVFVIPALRSGYDNNTAAVIAGVEADGHAQLIDMRDFMFGTGTVANRTGDGTNDWYRLTDNTHPSFDGHIAIARKAFALIATAMTS